MIRHTLLYIAVVAAAAIPARAQQPAPAAPADSILTLEQCIELALTNNATMRTSQNDLQSAVELRREAFTKYFPEVFGSVGAFWTHNDIFEYNILDLIEIGLIHKGKGAGITAMQPVFTGGQIVNGNKLAAVGAEVARLRREQSVNDLRLNTETMYWKLVTLQSTRGVVQAAINTLDTLCRQVQVAVDAGVAMRNDLLKVQLQRNTYRMEQVDLDNGIKLMKMLLGQYIGRGVGGDFDVVCAVPDTVPPYPSELYTPAARALPRTVDYQLLEQDVRAKDLERRIEVGRNMPTLAVGAGWYYHSVFNQNHSFGALMVTLSVPLSGWWGGSHAIKRRTLALENARIQQEDLGQKLQIEMEDKWDDLTAAHRKMEIAREGIVQSAENLRLNRLYYEAGISTITNLLDAEASDKEARDAYVAAYGTYRTARAAYLKSIGNEEL